MKFFTELLFDTQHGVLEFHFERGGYPSTTCYYVAVVAGTSPGYRFKMKESEGRWEIVDSTALPAWIVETEDILSNSIGAHRTRSASLQQSDMPY